MSMPKHLRQEVRQLKRRAERWSSRKIVVEGEKCIAELCKSDWSVERIYFTHHWRDADLLKSSLFQTCENRIEVGEKDMTMMSSLKSAPGILAVAKMPSSFNKLLEFKGTVLYLDNVSDPGNVGTLIRVADWFGLSGVVLSPESADPISAKAIQSSMGSLFHIPVVIGSIDEMPVEFKVNVVGLDAAGESIFLERESPKITTLVVGSESHGLSQFARLSCHQFLSIPGRGRCESLNASVAGAVAVSSLIQQNLIQL